MAIITVKDKYNRLLTHRVEVQESVAAIERQKARPDHKFELHTPSGELAHIRRDDVLVMEDMYAHG